MIEMDASPQNPLHAIYKFEGESLTIQFGTSRPMNFSREETLVLRRPGDKGAANKPPGQEAAKKR